jgi:cysteine desulfurase/selenocysteine lyase
MNKIRSDFPFLNQASQAPIVYLDNAATTQKPQAVLDAVSAFYTTINANIYRGVYTIGEQATRAYEQARAAVARFINASDHSEIVFTSGATASINAVAMAWAELHVHAGDHIIISELEHHANIIPWQQLAKRKQAILRYIPVLDDGTLDYDAYEQMLSPRVKLVSIVHVSNAIGIHNDVARIARSAHAAGAKVLVDAAQSVPHEPIDVQALECDFLVFSGHKMMAPTGIGVLYIARRIHDQLQPFLYGGGMVYSVDWQSATWQKMPQLLEAGTPPIAQAIGLQAAIAYYEQNIDRAQQRAHEARLCEALIDGLCQMPNVKIVGPISLLKKQSHIVSFTIDGMHPHDIAAYLDQYGICVRAGHHCAQPIAKRLGIESSVRVSVYVYNTLEEIEFLLEKVRQLV